MQAAEKIEHSIIEEKEVVTPKGHYELYKRIFDITFALFLLPFLIPFMLLIALLIKLDSRGAVVFVQRRTGYQGKEFNCYKFRTMIPNAEDLKKSLQHLNEMEGPVFKIREDPRLTRVGKYLRRYSFDELPQVFNILKGEMSFVGPRPLPVAEAVRCNLWQRQRLYAKPGLTCLWQISGRSNIQDFNQWIMMDLKYIQTASFKNDIKIILKTIPVILGKKGAY